METNLGHYNIELSGSFFQWMMRFQEVGKTQKDKSLIRKFIYLNRVSSAILYNYQAKDGQIYDQPLETVLKLMGSSLETPGYTNPIDKIARQVAKEWLDRFPNSSNAWLILANASLANLASHGYFVSEMYWYSELNRRKKSIQPMFELSNIKTNPGVSIYFPEDTQI